MFHKVKRSDLIIYASWPVSYRLTASRFSCSLFFHLKQGELQVVSKKREHELKVSMTHRRPAHIKMVSGMFISPVAQDDWQVCIEESLTASSHRDCEDEAWAAGLMRLEMRRPEDLTTGIKIAVFPVLGSAYTCEFATSHGPVCHRESLITTFYLSAE